MSSTELEQRAQESASVPPAQKEVSKPDLKENTSATSKPSAKQPAGIMGMFASKSAPKSQESSKDVKTEQKDDSSVVSVRLRCLMQMAHEMCVNHLIAARVLGWNIKNQTNLQSKPHE